MPIIMKQDRYGLGYKSNAKVRSNMMKMKREKRMASLVGVTVEGEHMVFLHYIRPSTQPELNMMISSQVRLPPWKIFAKLTINDIEGIEMKNTRAIVHPLSPGAAPKNWIATAIPTIFSLSRCLNNKHEDNQEIQSVLILKECHVLMKMILKKI